MSNHLKKMGEGAPCMPIAIDYLILATYISVDQMGNPVVNGILDEVRIEAANPRRETVPFVFSVLAHVSGASPGEISIPSMIVDIDSC